MASVPPPHLSLMILGTPAIHLVVRVGTLRLRRVKQLAPGHTANEWQIWDLTAGSMLQSMAGDLIATV